MIIETGKIVSIESEGVWVETIQRSVCGSCKAEKGCGQSLMAKWGAAASYIWVLLEGRNPGDYRLGDEIQIGVPEEVVVKASMLAYVMPLALLLMATVLAHLIFHSEMVTVLAALAGLMAGGLLLRWHSTKTRYDPAFQPVLIDDRQTLAVFEPAKQH